MKFNAATGALALLLATPLFAQPRISRVQNIYSYILPGMPNYGIAQGSIFGIFGTGLATALSDTQAVPLPKSLNGVSVSITVNGVTTDGILYYVAPTAIAAVLPSATPAGNGQVRVTLNGTSGTAPITVVPSAFGMIALNNVGNGPAAAFDLNAQYIGLTNAANPGDFITLWGTGLGPVTGDETMPPPIVNLADDQLEVDIGGIRSNIQYAGRTIYPGLDQINVQVPSSVSGCHVSVVVRSRDIVSNFGTIPVGSSGRTCAESVTGVTASQLASILSKSAVVRGVLDFISNGGNSSADASFGSFTKAQFGAKQPFAAVSFNDCTVYNIINNVTMAVANPIKPVALDAGPSISLTGSGIPNQSLPFQGGGYSIDNLPPLNSFRGTFGFMGSGGADIGPFSTQITLPGGLMAFNVFVPGSSASRSQGLTITWSQPSNIDPREFIQISGFALVPNAQGGAEFVCNVPLSSGRFTIPPAVLLALPSQQSVATPQAMLETDLILTQAFTAPGMDLGIFNFVTQSVVVPFSYQ